MKNSLHMVQLQMVQPQITINGQAIEPSTSLKRHQLVIGLVSLLFTYGVYANPPTANELPTGATIISGHADISGGPNVLNVQQNSAQLITDWQTFNIGEDATVNFVQPDANSIALNRVMSEGASQIYGQLNANGQVFLINPSGVLFSSGSKVDVGGLVASTLDISNEQFLAGNTAFEATTDAGSVINHGSLSSLNGGYIALMAPRVVNHGEINTDFGTTAMAAGNKVSLDFAGNQLVKVIVDEGAVSSLVDNKALINAANGRVFMSAKAADSILGSVVNNSGIAQATGISEKGGQIFLTAEGGDLVVEGNLDVSSDTEKAGLVHLTGDSVSLRNGSSINATGLTGGGEVLVGGGWQGSGGLYQAQNVLMEQGALIDASATGDGDGGTVVLWSDIRNNSSLTDANGVIAARGGILSGDGGAIETSSATVRIDALTVDAGAANGQGGHWLIDPFNWLIGPTNASRIETALNAGTSVTIDTVSSSGSESTANSDGTVDPALTGAGNISVDSAIEKTSGGEASLTLHAANNISINANISSSNAELNVILDADNDSGVADGNGVTVLAADISTNGGTLQFGTDRTLSIDGAVTKVGGDIYVNDASTLATSGGNVDVNGEIVIGTELGLHIDTDDGDLTVDGAVNSGNNYAFVLGTAGSGSWEQARTDARNGTAGGSAIGDSYLVNISSRLENSIATNATVENGSYRGSWIGGRRDKDSSHPNNLHWKWVDGPEAGQIFYVVGGGPTALFSNFNTGEPNGTGPGGEYVAQLFGDLALWNDLRGSATYSADMSSRHNVMGYVRETNLADSPLSISAGSGSIEFHSAIGERKQLGNLTINSADTVMFDETLNITGNLGITLNPGSVTPVIQSDTWNIGGSSSFVLGANNLTLTDASNDFVGAISVLSGGDVNITDVNDLSLGNSTLSGEINLLANNIILSGDLDTSDAAANGDVLLKATNNITQSANTLVTTSGSDITYWADSDASALGYISTAKSATLDSRTSADRNLGTHTIGGGDITLSGGSDLTTGYARGNGNNGVTLGGTLLSGGGNILARGRADFNTSAAFHGVGIDSGTSVNSGTGSISVYGFSDDAYGIEVTDSGLADVILHSAKASGDAIVIDGESSVSYGLVFNYKANKQLLATGGGDISIRGEATTAQFGIFYSNTDILASSGTITIDAGARGVRGAGSFPEVVIGSKAGSAISSSSSDINILSDRFGSSLEQHFDTTGHLSIAPSSTAFSVADFGDAFQFEGSIANDIFSGINEAASINIRNYSSLGGLTLGKIGNTSGIDISSAQTINGDVNVYGASIVLEAPITTINGNILLDADNDIALATGKHGIDLRADLTTSSSGDITLLGRSGNGAVPNIRGVTNVDTSGTIHATAISAADSITINGVSASEDGSSTRGVWLNDATLSAGSHIDISGQALDDVNDYDVSLQDSSVTTSNGDITLDSLNSGSISLAGSNNTLTAGGGNNIVLYADKHLYSAGSVFNGTGTISILPDHDSTSFSTAVDTSNLSFSNSLTGLTIGATGNSADITIGSVTNIAGPVNITGGNIAIDAALSATGSNTISLSSSGTVSDGSNGYLLADNLILLDGDVTLNHASNNISTLAASGLDALTYADSDTLTIASIASTDGIMSTGALDISTLAGDLTVSENLSGSNITLNAGRSASAGTATGGNIVLVGSPSISATSGRAILYSGSVTNSGGLSGLIGSGSGNFRYNSDESASNFTASLGANGHYAIYREQPTLTVSAVNETVTYGTAPVAAVSVGDGINGDTTAQILSATPSLSIGGGTSASGHYTAGVHSLTFAGPDVDQLGYALNPVNGTLTVNQKIITPLLSVSNRTYDGTNDAMLSASAADAIFGDTVVVDGDASFDNKNVGTSKTVDVTDLRLTGADADNYTLASSSATLSADIGQKALTISGITAANKVYDGSTDVETDSSAISFSGLLSGDNLELDESAGSFSDKNVGNSKTVALTNSYSGNDVGNYSITDQSTTTADISQKTLSVSGITAENKVYDGNATASVNSNDALLSGVIVGDDLSLDSSAGTFVDKNASANKTVNLNNNYSGADKANYNIVDQTTTTADIAQKVVILSGVTAENKVYDAGTGAAINISGAEIAGIVSGDSLELDSSTGAFADKNAGIAKTVTLTNSYTGIDRDNYVVSGQTSASADISRKSLTVSGITADNKVYDGTNSAQTDNSAISFSGLLSGDNLELDESAGSFSDKNVGNGKIVALTNSYSGNDAENYSITDQTTATADISQKTLSVSGITAENKVYDGSTAASTNDNDVAFNGLVAGDNFVLNSSTGTFTDKNAGTGKTVALSNSYSGTDLANYSVIDQTAALANITQKALTIRGISAENKHYDGRTTATVNTSHIEYVGIVAGDNVILESSSGLFSDKNAAINKFVSLSNTYTGTDIANYNLTDQTSTSANVLPKGLAVTGISANDKVYDGSTEASLNTEAATYDGLLIGDDVRLLTASGLFADENAGLGKTVAINARYFGTDLENYIITTQPVTSADITRKPLTVTANNSKKDFDGLSYNGSNGVTYSGFITGESPVNLDGRLSYAGSSQTAVEVGDYELIPGGLSSTNYQLLYVNGILQIEQLDVLQTESGRLQQLTNEPTNPMQSFSDRPFYNLPSYSQRIKERPAVVESEVSIGLYCTETASCTSVEGLCVESREARCDF